MTEKYCCLFVPVDKMDTVQIISDGTWNITRELTTDGSQVPPATHYGASGVGDADKADAIAAVPGVIYSELGIWDALAAAGLYLVQYPQEI